MERPLRLEVDFDPEVGPLGYLRYRVLERGQYVARNERVSQDVIIDYDAESRVLGIEFLALDDDAISVARRFAQAHNLVFPEIAAQPAVA